MSSSACVQQHQIHGLGEMPGALASEGTCLSAFSSTSYSGTQLALFCTGVGQFQASLRFISLGSDRAIVCSLTGKCSWRQAVELSVGVKTSLVLEAWDIHHSICTGKRRGNSCKSKEYGTSLQPTL